VPEEVPDHEELLFYAGAELPVALLLPVGQLLDQASGAARS
jgi:hypothetical protein